MGPLTSFVDSTDALLRFVHIEQLAEEDRRVGSGSQVERELPASLDLGTAGILRLDPDGPFEFLDPLQCTGVKRFDVRVPKIPVPMGALPTPNGKSCRKVSCALFRNQGVPELALPLADPKVDFEFDPSVKENLIPRPPFADGGECVAQTIFLQKFDGLLKSFLQDQSTHAGDATEALMTKEVRETLHDPRLVDRHGVGENRDLESVSVVPSGAEGAIVFSHLVQNDFVVREGGSEIARDTDPLCRCSVLILDPVIRDVGFCHAQLTGHFLHRCAGLKPPLHHLEDGDETPPSARYFCRRMQGNRMNGSPFWVPPEFQDDEVLWNALNQSNRPVAHRIAPSITARLQFFAFSSRDGRCTGHQKPWRTRHCRPGKKLRKRAKKYTINPTNCQPMRIPYRKPTKFSHVPFDPLVTKEKTQAMQQRLETLKQKRMGLASEVARLAEMGDFSENAAYQTAKGRLRGLNENILKLEDQLSRAVLIAPQTSHAVEIGHTVTIEENGKQKIFRILGSAETNPQQGVISYTSPIGAALLGKKVGDTVGISLPKKKLQCTIVRIE